MNIEDRVAALEAESGLLDHQFHQLGSLLSTVEANLPGNALQDAEQALNAELERALGIAIAADVVRLTQCIETVREGVAALEGRLTTAAQEVRTATETTVQGIASASGLVNGTLDDVESRIADAMVDLADAHEQFTTATTDLLAEFVDAPVSDAAGEVTERVEAFTAELTQKTTDLIVSAAEEGKDTVREHTADVATPVVEFLNETIDGMFTDARERILGNSEDASTKREAMEAILDAVEPAFHALQDAFERVQGVAGGVGISL